MLDEVDRNAGFTTISGIPIERLYTPSEIATTDPAGDIGVPGQFPFTRGLHPTGYRGKLDDAHVCRLRNG